MNGMHPSTEREKPEVHLNPTAPFLPHFGLTSLQVVCTIELSKGRKAIDIKKQFNITNEMWVSWQKNPRFTEHVTDQLIQREAIVRDVLREGEVQASATLLGALAAEVPMRHKDGKIRLHPNWEVRVRAAISLLDRQGQRGKPVERVQSANTNTNINTAEVRNEISAALADPAVRAFLEADPTFAASLRAQLLRLGDGQEEPPCDTSTSPTSSSPPPAPDSGPSPTADTEPSSPE